MKCPFKKVSIPLTAEQVETLQPFFKEVEEAFERDKLTVGESRAAVFAQVYKAGHVNNEDHMVCYLFTPQQGLIVKEAIEQAGKVKKSK